MAGPAPSASRQVGLANTTRPAAIACSSGSKYSLGNAVDLWINSLYHRLPLLHPGLMRIGAAVVTSGRNTWTCIQYRPGTDGSVRAPHEIFWPPPDVPNTDRTFNGNEGPCPTADDPLDFFVLFSSMAAVAGNAGQADYGFANHYMDSFAFARERMRAAGVRRGKTLSLNWSLWADGGMRVDEQTEQMFTRTLGLKLLATATGTEAMRSIETDVARTSLRFKGSLHTSG